MVGRPGEEDDVELGDLHGRKVLLVFFIRIGQLGGVDRGRDVEADGVAEHVGRAGAKVDITLWERRARKSRPVRVRVSLLAK